MSHSGCLRAAGASVNAPEIRCPVAAGGL
jgi:hypothetical protein